MEVPPALIFVVHIYRLMCINSNRIVLLRINFASKSYLGHWGRPWGAAPQLFWLEFCAMSPSFEPSPFCLEKMLLGEGKLGKVGKGFHTKANVWVGCISRPLNGSLDDPGRIISSPQKGHIGVNMFKLSVRHGQNHLFCHWTYSNVLSVYSSGILQNDLVFNGILSSTVWTKSHTQKYGTQAQRDGRWILYPNYIWFFFVAAVQTPFQNSWKIMETSMATPL